MVEGSHQTAVRTPASTEELVEIVTGGSGLRISGSGSSDRWRLPAVSAPVALSMREFAGVVEFNPDDQVVVVRAGTLIADLQGALAESGQCLPLAGPFFDGTVGGALSLNLPHSLEAECGTWRDWVLGLTAVLADGTVVKSGSRAVKNVAGYDLQKLFIGARGTLGIVVEVILRTYPVASLPEPDVRMVGEPDSNGPLWVQRVLPSDFPAATAQAGESFGFDIPGTSTLIRRVPPDRTLRRFAGDWVLRSGCGGKNLELSDPTQVRLMLRAKDLFDPARKFNPGEMGVF